MLGGLVRDRHADHLAELTRPHAGAVDDVLALDVAARGLDAGDPTQPTVAHDVEPGDRGVLDQGRTRRARPLGERHRHADRIGATVLGDVEPREHVVDVGEREPALDLLGWDLVHVDPHQPVERRHAAILLQPIGIRRDLDEAGAPEPGRLPGLLLEALVQITAVLAHPCRGFRRGTERDHQPGGMPGGPRCQLVALEQHDVFPPHVSEVVRDGTSDDAAADDDDARPCR